jgi:hypothetical protein
MQNIRHRTNGAFLAILTAGLAAHAFAQPGSPQPEAAKPEPALLTLPFELASNKIYMQTDVNGEGPYPFVLDTGAPFSVLDWDLADSLKIRVFHTGDVGGAGLGTVKLGTATGVRIAVDGLRYQPRRMEVIPLNETLSPAEGRDVMGLIGDDVLERFVTEFDFAGREVRLYKPHSYSYEGNGSKVPVTVQGHILARATVTFAGREPIDGRFIIDTGARIAVSLTTHVVNEHKLMEGDVKHVRTIVGWGLGGPLEHGLARAEQLKVGDVTFDAPTVTLSQDTRGVLASRSVSGIIGNEVLKRCRVIIDLPREELILEPTPAAMKAPFPADCSGLFITASGEGYRTFTVRDVAETTPAAEAGIKMDDVIDRVDGGPALRYTLEELRELLRSPGKSYDIELKRGDERINVKLTTRDLI